jgi:hypothetical protein
MAALVNLYFIEVNIFLPLLHRPTFERSIAEELHLSHDQFGETLLLVCAVGALYSNDPRVFLEEFESSHSCGWKWFMQVDIMKKKLMEPPTLYSLQRYAVRETRGVIT